MDRLYMLKWLITILFLGSTAQAVPVYRWVDDNGQVNYSDRPGPGAVLIELSTGAPTLEAGPSSPRGPQRATELRTPAVAAYETLAVLQPASRETLWGTAGRVEIAIGISPGLQSGHSLALFMDGELVQFGNHATGFLIEDVPRGEHTVQAVILDAAERELLRSAPVTFFVQQTSIHYPRNPGRVR